MRFLALTLPSAAYVAVTENAVYHEKTYISGADGGDHFAGSSFIMRRQERKYGDYRS